MRIVFCLLVALFHAGSGVADEPLQLHMPDAPPLTLLHYEGGHGMVGDVTLAAIALSGRLTRVIAEPWPRAQARVASGRNLLIIPLSRIPEREDRYTWIAPIMVLERAFFSIRRVPLASPLDTDGDGRISKAEAAAQPRFAERFDTMDANKDGVIDRTDRELRGKQHRDAWFAKADADKDGKLTRAEIDQAHAARRAEAGQRRQARMDARFATADANKDGRLSRDEVKDSRLASRFDALDANKDGSLSRDELAAGKPAHR